MTEENTEKIIDYKSRSENLFTCIMVLGLVSIFAISILGILINGADEELQIEKRGFRIAEERIINRFAKRAIKAGAGEWRAPSMTTGYIIYKPTRNEFHFFPRCKKCSK